MTATLTGPERKRRMGFDMINRRTHLYAGLFFVPWFLFYGLSAGVFNHPSWFDNSPLKMTQVFDRPYMAAVPQDPKELPAFVEKALRENGLEGPFVLRWELDGTVRIFLNRFLSNTNVVIDPKTHRIGATRGYPSAHSVLTRIHTRSEYRPTAGLLENFWALIVDLVQLSILIWIASGIYMWWHLKRFRQWGWLALGSGVALFAVFLIGL